MNEEQKNKEQQIEEMAQIICGRSKDDICLIDKTSCDSSCRWARDAEALYNAGYRKLPDGATVLLVGKYNQALDEKTIEYFIKHNEQIRKETAEKILDLLVPDCKACDENWHSGCLCLRATLAEKIAKQFGVEIKE